MRKVMTSMLAVAALASAAMAGAVKSQNISADAMWAIHLDAEALLRTGVAKLILAEVEKKDDFLNGIAQIRQVFGLDPLRDVRGVTVYGKVLGGDQIVALIDATVDENNVVGMLMNNSTYRGRQYGDHTLHEWTDNGKPGKPPKTQHACFFDRTTVLIAGGLELLKGAVDVLDGKAKSMAKTGGMKRLSKPPAGAFLVGAAEKVKIPVEDDNPHALVVRAITDLALQVGEAGDAVFVNFTAVTRTADRALKLRQMVQGVVAMAQTQVEQREDIPALGEKVEITGEDTVSRLRATVPIESVKKLVQSLIAEDELKKAEAAQAAAEAELERARQAVQRARARREKAKNK